MRPIILALPVSIQKDDWLLDHIERLMVLEHCPQTVRFNYLFRENIGELFNLEALFYYIDSPTNFKYKWSSISG